MIRYCPSCWAENVFAATTCATCGAGLIETDKDYAERLMDAVGHTEPTRAALPAEILGRLKEARAVDKLIARLNRRPDSMDVTAAAATALGLIDQQRATPALADLLLDSNRPLPARLAAAEALAALGGPDARQALMAALTLPRLPHLLRRLIETDARLQALQNDLAEYVRKHSWQFRDEPVSEAEGRSWVRAVAWLRGEGPGDEGFPL